MINEFYLDTLFNINSNSITLYFKYFISLIYFIFFIYNASKGSSISLLMAVSLIFKYIDLSPFAFILSGSVFLIGAFLIEKNKKNKKDMDMYESKK